MAWLPCEENPQHLDYRAGNERWHEKSCIECATREYANEECQEILYGADPGHSRGWEAQVQSVIRLESAIRIDQTPSGHGTNCTHGDLRPGVKTSIRRWRRIYDGMRGQARGDLGENIACSSPQVMGCPRR